MRPRLLPRLSVAFSLSVLGCGAGARAPSRPPEAALLDAATPSSAQEFPAQARAWLRAPRADGAAQKSLPSLVQFQLARAERLFDAGHHEAGADAVVGALLLLGKEDALGPALAGRDRALLEAAHHAARRGEAGLAGALYDHARAYAGSAAVRADIDQHLGALAAYRAGRVEQSELALAGEAARDALARAMVDPRSEGLTGAQKSVVAWLEAALASGALSRAPDSVEARDEALEAYSALRAGTPGLVAACLRQGEPALAARTLEQADLGRAMPGGVGALLESADSGRSVDAWLELFRIYDTARREDSAEAALPPYVADGAALWSAIGLFRASPGRIDHAMPLAMSIAEFGMPEVASAVLAESAGPESSGESLSWSLALLSSGLVQLGETGQLEAARQSLAEAEPLLALASGPRFEGVLPRPAAVYALLGALEIQQGFTKRALPLLERAASAAPSAESRIRLAELYRQAGRLDDALGALQAAVEHAARRGDVLTEARAEELLFEIERGRGEKERAAAALRRSLERTLTARAMDLRVVSEAAVERQLARLLEHYREPRSARRAYQRALDASRHSTSELQATLTDMARSALTTGDVRLARLATQSALDLNLDSADLVYVALWQRLVERRTGSAADGLASQVLDTPGATRGWQAQLRAFGAGDLDAAALIARARTIPEKTEAAFYVALWDGGPERVRAAMLEVAASPALDLVEVSIARALVAPPGDYPLPTELPIP